MTRYSILTDGKGLVQVVSSPIDNIPTNPGVTPPVSPSPNPPGMDTGVAWLMSNQKSDGSWQNLALSAVRDTAEATTTLKDFTSAQANYTAGLQWLSGANPVNVDYLSRKIEVLSASGQEVQALVSELVSRQNADGGWGSNGLYRSTPVDTAFALRALTGIQYADQNAVARSVEYLLAKQKSDGGWGFYQEDQSNVLMTATVSGVLQKFTSRVSVAAAIEKAKNYILSHQNSDGGFGSSPSTVYETALAYMTLSGVTTDGTVLGNALNFLMSEQSADGSWIEDPYSTALAVRVLYLTKDLPATPPVPTTSTVTGKVIDGTTNQPLGNVTVVLLADAGINAVTDAAGNFTLSKVPAGSQNISLSLSGYMTTTIPVDSSAGSIMDIGTNSLYPVSTAGVIRGSVTDVTNGDPLANAFIEVTGAFTGTVSTGADGSFVIGNVTPGSLTLTASKDGYEPVSSTATIDSGEVLFFYPQLSPVSTQSTTGSATGKVIDATTGQPLNGVSVVLQGNTNIKTTTDSTGAFTLSNIPAGNQKISLSYSGYGTTTVSANIPGGSTLDLGVLPLTSDPTVGVLKGTVTDADKGQPLEGVTIVVTGSFSGSAVTGTDGGFVIGDITPGSITFTASKPGYYSLNGSSTITAGEITFFNFQMTPLAQPGTLRGKVFDAASNTPIKGALVFISGGPETSTGEEGVFTISGIVPGTYEVNISASGYQSQKYQIIISGSTTDMQTIFLSPISTSTTVTGTVTDTSTGNPISNADVVIVGTGIAANTDSSGAYTLSGINLLEFNLKASAAGYDTRFNGVNTETYGQYVIDVGLSRSQASNVEIIALGTDKQSYSAKNAVTITADIRNTGATPVDVIITAQVMDQDNNLLAVISYGADPYLTLNPNSSEALSLQWDTGLYPPGNYNVILGVVDSGKGSLLAEGYTTFGIASTVAIDGLVPLMTPKFLNIGATAIVSISASMTNSSNVDVSLVAEYEIRDTGGNIITGGTVDFTITPAESLKTVELGKLTYTFAASGRYPVTVKISSAGSLVLENSDAIYVSPSMRIEATKILSPTTVAPDGDKRIRIDIRLEGVEVTQ
jgi:protocatechuate 3,4-dioxygenase beta subunit/prenyltransferase beta subunit